MNWPLYTHFASPSSVESVDVLLGDGVRMITIPTITIPDDEDWTLEVNWRRQLSDGSNIAMMSRNSTNNTLACFDNGEVRYSGVSTAQFADALDSISVGTDVNIRMTYTYGEDDADGAILYIDDVMFGETSPGADGGFTIDRFYGNPVNSDTIVPASSAMWGIEIINNTTGEAWKYPVDEGAGTDILCYDENDDLKPANDGTATPDADWGTL